MRSHPSLRVGGDAHCQDLIVYKMFGRIVYSFKACKFF